jgi:hypothetical protein
MRSVLVAPESVTARHALASRGGDVGGLDARLRRHLGELLARPLYVPESKALLSRWGAHCRDDEAELVFDPWEPRRHRCSKCSRIWSTEQSHRWWVYGYQSWLAERVWLLALYSSRGALAGARERAVETLALLVERYRRWPNADNVLGPSRPFFSTYLESIWVLQLAAAASLLGEQGLLPGDLERDLREHLFRPSADLIADFDEGRSNRQVWNAAALLAIGGALEDSELAERAARGFVKVLEGGLLEDGLWFEGEHYHWFALRGLTWGAGLLATSGGPDLWSDRGAPAAKFRAAFTAPLLTALPDFTLPARRDAKFGVSLRQRRFAELWEMALSQGAVETRWGASLLAHLYDAAIEPGDDLETACTEIERNEPAGGVRRVLLGWKGWLSMQPELPAAEPEAWRPGTAHLEATGLAVIRRDSGATMIGFDYGEPGGGHGHPDRLNLTLVARGTPWLLDFGTGSYVAPSLPWYRSTLAHNAPLVDAVSQAPARGHCVAWDEADGWTWVCAQLPENTAYDGVLLQRTLVAGPGYLLDVLQLLSTSGERQLALPWHGLGAAGLDETGVTFTQGERSLVVKLAGRQPFNVLLRRAPGPPSGAGAAAELEFPVVVAQGEEVTLAACVDLGAGVEELDCSGESFVVRLGAERFHVHSASESGWTVELDRGDPVVLDGLRELPEPVPAAGPLPGLPAERFSIGGAGLARRDAASETVGVCSRVSGAPACDGTLAGFDTSAPLLLDQAVQFRRAERPWGGPEEFSAACHLNHDGEFIYVAVAVTAPGAVFRRGDVPDPEWENENPDIHSDGLQLYVETPLGLFGWLLVPDPDARSRVRVAGVRGGDGEPEMVTRSAWQPAERGYLVTCALDVPEALDGEFGFDLLVNQADEALERRTGQLVFSGARGERLYLAGDRPLNSPLPRVRVG